MAIVCDVRVVRDLSPGYELEVEAIDLKKDPQSNSTTSLAVAARRIREAT